jgi:hypothetical protein
MWWSVTFDFGSRTQLAIWQVPQAARRLVCKTLQPNLSTIIHFSLLTDYLYRPGIPSSRTTTYSAIWPALPSPSSAKLPDLLGLCEEDKKKEENENLFNYCDGSIMCERT